MTTGSDVTSPYHPNIITGSDVGLAFLRSESSLIRLAVVRVLFCLFVFAKHTQAHRHTYTHTHAHAHTHTHTPLLEYKH